MSIFAAFFASLLFVLRNFFGLIFYPYKTMRVIAQEKDRLQLYIIFALVYCYFIAGNIIRNKTLHPFVISSSSLTSFAFFIITFFLVTTFFWGINIARSKKTSFASLVFTFAYSLLPTLIWFFTTSLLFLLLPPPRTTSFLGQSFSVVFLIFSLSLLWWRLILLYLSVRFSLKTNFYTTVFYILLFLLWFLPFSYLMFYLKIFRIPFI